MMYYNYHKHDHYGNPWIPDTVTKPEDYCKRAVELGHTTVFTTNHGVQGNIFDWLEQTKKYNLKMCYGTEAYFVYDRFPDSEGKKDRSNKHLIIIAKNNSGVMQLNDIMSEAHTTGFYYRPRIDKELLFSLNPHDFIITSACVAGIWDDHELCLEINRYFKNNFFLEVQSHNIDIQKKANTDLLDFSRAANIPLIHANDSHYIYPDDAKYRNIFVKGKGLNYSDEDGMVLDYPDSDEIFKRYHKQGVLTKSQVQEALENTYVFEECEPITIINDDIKLPSVSDHPTEELKEIINRRWKEERKSIQKERWPEYIDAIHYEMDIIEKTHMENYFLIDYNVAKIGQEKYGGRLTNTGRGSAPSFYVTKLLGLTDIDRLEAPITLFPTRFMSVERILGTRSLPDKYLQITLYDNVNKWKKMWSVYIHINKINSKKYIGITSQNPKDRWGTNGCKYHSGIIRNAIKKYGWDNFYHIVLYENKSENEAKEIEKYLIKLFNTKAPNGYNLTDGGDGALGINISKETRKRMSAASKEKWKNENFKNKMIAIRNSKDSPYQSDDFKKKISKLVSGTKNPNYAHYWSEEQKNNLREKQKKNPVYKNDKNPNAKKIRCVETGEIFLCMKYAQEKYGLKSTGSFTVAIKNPNKTAAGYHWELIE